MARVEVIFNLIDRVSSGMERISGASKRAEERIADAGRRVDEFSRKSATATLDVNTAQVYSGVAAATAAVDAFGSITRTATLKVNTVMGGDRMTNVATASPFQRSTFDRMFGGGGGAGTPSPPGGGGGGNDFFRSLGRGFGGDDDRFRMPFGISAGPVFGSAGPIVALVTGIAAALTPVIPLLGAVGAGTAAILPPLLALGAGFVTLGAVAVPTLSKVAEKYKAIEDARKKVQAASGFDERNRALAELRLAEAQLSENERRLIENFRGLKKEWEEATKPIKEDVFTIANNLVSAAKPLIDTMTPFMRLFSQVFVRSSEAIQGFFGDPGRQRLLTEAFRPLPRILEQVLNSMGSLFQIVLGLSAAASPMAEKLFGAIERSLGARADYVTSARGIESIRATFERMEPILQRLGRLVKNFWGDLKEIGRAAEPFVIPMMDALGAIGGALTTILVEITNTMGGEIQSILRNFAQIIQKLTPGVVRVVSIIVRVIDGVLAAANRLPAGALKVAGMATAIGLIATKVPGLRSVTRLVLQLARVGAGRGLQIIGQLIGGRAGNALSSLGGGLLERGTPQNPMWVAIVSGMGGGAAGAAGRGGRAGQVARGVGRGVAGVTGGAAVGVGVNEGLDALTGNDKVGDVLGGAAGGAIAGAAIGSIFPGPGTAVGAVVGGVAGGLAGLFGFANGGVVRRPTVARIGERGPEAIIPLDNGIRAGQVAREAGLVRGNIGSLVTIAGPVHINNGQDMDQFTKQLAREVRLAAATLVGG